MMKTRLGALSFGIACVALVAGCAKQGNGADTKPARKAAMEPPAPMKRVDPQAPYRCKADADCQITCYGTWNRAWYQANEGKLNECKDGCAGWARRVPKCVNGLCEAHLKGQVDKHCTRQKPRWRK